MDLTSKSLIEQKSQFLHALRWISALVVIVGHSQLLGGNTAPVFKFLASHAHAAVMVFFVLSGYVITATSEKNFLRGYTLKQYFSDRISRIYSVLVPAIILTLILDYCGGLLYPARYSDPDLLPQTQRLIRFLINLSCLQGIWGYRVQLGSNPALWSVGYEFCYYVIFGLVRWKPKYWKILVFAILIIIGPKVAFYGLIWALGALAYKLKFKTSFIATLIVLLISNHFLEYRPVFLPEYLRDLLFGVAVALFILAQPRIPTSFHSFNEWMAEFSYSLYAYHMPIMFLFFSFFGTSLFAAGGAIILSLAAARGLYFFTENRRAALKSALTRLPFFGDLRSERPT